MHAQLEAICREFDSARERLRALAREVPENGWTRRPDPARWSIAECIAHLNLTSSAFLPLVRGGLARARTLKALPPRRYRRDPIGWMLWKTAGPPVRFRVKTTAPFVPAATEPAAVLTARFEDLQSSQLAAVQEADGLPIDRVRITSPFNPRIRYNLYACLTILPRHQHRHLWQAEQVLRAIGAGSAGRTKDRIRDKG